MDELETLLAKSEELQKKEMVGEGVKVNYLLLAKSASKALKRSEKDLYIEGLRIGDIYLQKEKINFSETLDVIPLSFITIYNERESADNGSTFYGVWNREQAMNYPVADGSYFNRQLPNGHILIPVHWVMVKIKGRNDIENLVIAFKSTGSRIWKKWKEEASTRGTTATQVYRIKEGQYSNDKFDWTDFDFEYVGNLVEMDRNEAVESLKMSNAIRESYENRTLIADHSVEKTTTALISDASDEEIPF